MKKNGFSLIELTITVGVIAILGVGLWSAWIIGLQVTSEKRAEVTATSLATESLERIKTLPYNDVGTINGIPSGSIPQTETVVRNTITYTVSTAIFYIDDPFDDTAPTDVIPSDYKRIRVSASWTGKFGVSPVVLMTDIAPRGIETTSGGGTILLRIANAYAEPVPNATVLLSNTSVTPAVNLTLTSNAEGIILLPGAPASQEGYDVRVTKDGYSADGTTRAEIGVNPNPKKPPLSVFEGKLTEALFEIDHTAQLTIRTVDNRGSPEWWRSTWLYRKNITIENNTTTDAPADTPIAINLDHAALIQEGKSLASGDDVRIIFWNGTYFEELDRINTSPWNTGTTRLWFATKKTIKKNEEDTNYAIYYGNTATTNPPASPSRVFPPPITTDTVGLWYLDEGKGSTIARDASGYGHDGTLVNLNPETAWVQGKFGSALAFPGSGCCPLPHVRVTSTPALSQVDVVTIEAWIYPTRNIPDQAIVSKIDSSKLIGTYQLYQDYRSVCLFVWKSPNPYDGKGCGGQVTLNAWNHVAGTFDGRYIRTYLNGALVGTAEKPGVLSKTAWVELNIGRYAGHNWEPYNGSIDTVAVHRTAKDSFPYGVQSNLTAEVSSERSYQEPNAIAGVTMTITGSKTVGTDDLGKPIPKIQLTKTSDANGTIVLSPIEWDTYTIALDGERTGYDIAVTSPLLPFIVAPATSFEERLTLVAHRATTLLVTVKNQQTPLDGASVRLTNGDVRYDRTIITGETGQSFFSPLTADTTYDLTITKPGYTTATTTVRVNGQTHEDIPLAPL